jgi:hypothetical protein
MSRIGWMLLGGLVVLAVQATSTADDYSLAQRLFSRGDCSRGVIETRIDCLTWEVARIKARLDGRFGEFVPLGPHEEPLPNPSDSPRVMPPWPPLEQPSPPPVAPAPTLPQQPVLPQPR